jgi:hypothetical protein
VERLIGTMRRECLDQLPPDDRERGDDHSSRPERFRNRS